MKKRIIFWSTAPDQPVLARLLILPMIVFLLTTGLSLKANLVLQEQKVVPSGAPAQSYFGRAVAIDGSEAVIGAFGDNNFQGAAYVFTKSNGVWSQAQKLTASDGRSGEGFGNSVALSGDILVVGASGATINGASGQGAVYVFNKVGDTWVESQKLTASDGVAQDDFGVAVALSGRTLVVGADDARVNDNFHEGAAYVFVVTNGAWRQAQKLSGDDSGFSDNFGATVAARDSLILVGAPNKTIPGGDFLTGEVYVFSRTDNSWNQTQSIIAPADSGFFADFGSSLALDRSTALIGAPHATANGHGAQGAAYFFAISAGTLSQTQMITSRDGASNDEFGFTVALAGNRAIVGAPEAQVGTNSALGKAYPFQESNGTWSQVGLITASDASMTDDFAFDVALDRETALVGVAPATVPQIGSAYFYTASAEAAP